MKINTGNGFIPLVAMVGIWSVSALTALPGLAVSPIMGDLSNIFPKSSQMEIQMLTSLPSLLILPLILLSGYLSQKVNFYKLLMFGLISFATAGVLYLLCNKMWQLVIVSAFLGIGAGLIIPLSTGLISIFFSGEVRVRQFGYSSAISNVMVVLATFVTGYLATISWKLPFLVYLLPFISIILVIPLKKYWPKECADCQKDTNIPDNISVNIPKTKNSTTHVDLIKIGRYGFDVGNLIKLMAFYGITTFIVVSIIFYLPFLVKSYGMSEEESGNMISLFFLAMMLPGFFLEKIIKVLKNKFMLFMLLVIAFGFLNIILSHKSILILLGVILVGLGYGSIQPMCYNKAVELSLKRKETITLALVMIMNYFAILICPIIIDWFKELFNKTDIFALQISTILTVFVMVVLIFFKKYLFFLEN